MSMPLWEPNHDEKEKTLLTIFSRKMKKKYSLPDIEYSTIHQWSIQYPELFWKEVWNDCEVLYSEPWIEVMKEKTFSRGIDLSLIHI